MPPKAPTTDTNEALHVERRGLLFILSSPSGAGKTSLSRRLLADDDDITMSISITTRAPRPGEQEGVDYYFSSMNDFIAKRDAGELLEWAKVFDNYYGTPVAPVKSAIEQGRDVLFDIDWQGAQQLSERLPGDVVRVFILPPSGDVLEARLRSRAQDSDEVVARRMEAAATELSHWPEYDYVIVNDDLETSGRAIQSILIAERLKRDRQLGLTTLVRTILSGL